MLRSKIAKLSLLSLSLLVFIQSAEAKIPSKKPSCEAVFTPAARAAKSPSRYAFRLQEVPKSEQYFGIQTLTPRERSEFFGDLNSRTPMSKAIQLMGKLPGSMSGQQKAEIWNELTQEMICGKTPCLDSTMFLMDGPRYLFRGESAESLYIDLDGTVYGVKVDAVYDNDVWQPDYARMQRLSH